MRIEKHSIAGALFFAAITAHALTLRPGHTEIVIAPKAPQTVVFAAKELKAFLSQALGAEVPVARRATPGMAHVRIGAEAAEIDVSAFARDEFRIVVRGDDVRIAGRDDPKVDIELALAKRNVWGHMYERATLFGVYEFLERYVGVRFYFPGELGTVVPSFDAIEIAETDFAVRPDWTLRRYSFGEDGLWFEGENRSSRATLPLRFLNAYRLRMETHYMPFCHGTTQHGYLKRFAKTHPEYFVLRKDGRRELDPKIRFPGHFCHTSGIWDELYLDAKSYLSGEDGRVRGVIDPSGGHSWWYGCQERKYVDLMPQDGMPRCACANCQAAYDDEPVSFASTLIWGNMAKVGNRLIAEGVPGYVTQMAYGCCRKVPDVDLPTNVLVQVAERGPWAKVDPKSWARDNAEIAAWAKKVGQKVSIWTYPCKYGNSDVPALPTVTPHCWIEYYQEVAPHLYGAFAESYSDRWLHNHLNYYLFSKIAWNNRVDANALLAEYYRLMYGSAAGEMERLFDAFEDKWLNGFIGKPVETSIGPMWRPATEEDIWTKAYTAEVLDGWNRLMDTAAAKTAPGSLERRRVELMRREILDPVLNAAAAYWKRLEDVKAFRGHAPETGGEPITLTFYPLHRAAQSVEKPVRTEVRAWKTATALEMRFVCEEPEMSETRSFERKFDDSEIWTDDNLEIFLNPTGDRNVYYHIFVNSVGSSADMKQVAKGEKRGGDMKWNSGMSVRVERGEKKWTAAISVPLASLPGISSELPAEFVRGRVRKGVLSEYYHWSRYARNPNDIDGYGTLEL